MQRSGGRLADATPTQQLVVLVAVGALLAALAVVVDNARNGGRSAFGDTWVGGIIGRDQGPPVVHVDHPHRLLAAPSATASADYAVLTEISGQPVRWDPCQPIRYVVSGTEPFLGADALLKDAFAKASAATGLKFIDEGVTAEQPTAQRAPYQPLLYGDRWAPVLVAWTDGRHAPPLGNGAIGLGGPRIAYVDRTPRLVSGIVYFDSPGFREMVSWPDVAGVGENVMLHEIGHLVGLDHVDDPSAVMYPQAHNDPVYGAGDRAGLALMGSGPCYSSR